MNYEKLYTLVSESTTDIQTLSETISTEFSSIEYIGHGVHRIVFTCDKQTVVKVPLKQSYKTYSQIEFYNYKSLQNTRFEQWIAPIDMRISSPEGKYTVMEIVDMSMDCEQTVVSNLSRAFTTVENGLDNFGEHQDLGSVAVDYTEPILENYRCSSYPL